MMTAGMVHVTNLTPGSGVQPYDLAATDCESVQFSKPALAYIGSLVPNVLKPWSWFKK
jgi:hypothetical protein